MAIHRDTHPTRFSQVGRVLRLLVLVLFGMVGHSSARALQFDVFPGYDSVAREAHWFPITFEVKNDGPTFTAIIEVGSPQMGRSQSRQVPLELPTGTLKRVTVPVFASSRYGNIEARLLTAKGKVLAEQEINSSNFKQTTHETVVLGALARTAAGTPSFPQIKRNGQRELQPTVARIQPSVFPDNPISLEGLQALYLNSERALDLKVPQVNALVAWVENGGHLIVGVEQPADIAGNPWIGGLLPCELQSMSRAKAGEVFHNWLRDGSATVQYRDRKSPPNTASKSISLFTAAGTDIKKDAEFEAADLEVAQLSLREGRVLAESGGQPLAVQANRGRGKVTVLAFSPERKPFVSWANRAWFWAMLTEVQPDLYVSNESVGYGGYSADGVFGSMIESKQIRKLPLTWLLLLLGVYLVVIGPLDQYWLKKINRQMLTWVTFPIYVVCFSGLIYFIGFKLRAGDSEYNELHLIDVLPSGEKAVLRGRTYASLYSPSNQRYPLKGEQFFATLRGEFLANWGNGQESSQATVIQTGNNFSADIFVPVWTSQLYVNDWVQPVQASPVTISLTRNKVTVRNNLDRKLSDVRVCVKGLVYEVGEVPADSSKDFDLNGKAGLPVRDFARSNGSQFFNAVERRRQTFGGDEYKQSWNLPVASMAASFISQVNEDQNYRKFVSPGSLDLSSLADEDHIILLAWDGDHSVTKNMNQFSPRRSQQHTLLRLVVPVN